MVAIGMREKSRRVEQVTKMCVGQVDKMDGKEHSKTPESDGQVLLPVLLPILLPVLLPV